MPTPVELEQSVRLYQLPVPGTEGTVEAVDKVLVEEVVEEDMVLELFEVVEDTEEVVVEVVEHLVVKLP